MFSNINPSDIIDDYEYMISDCFCKHINTIYFWARSELQEKGIDDIEESKKLFIKILEEFLIEKRAILSFNEEVVGPEDKKILTIQTPKHN